MKWAYLLAALAFTASCSLLDEEDAVEERTLEDAIVIPTDIQQVIYPDSYTAPVASVVVKNPYCALVTETAAYPSSYLGTHPLPDIGSTPLPAGIRRAVGLKDAWVPEDPNFNSCRTPDGARDKDSMFTSFKGTLQRASALGAQQIHATNYISFEDFENATLDYSSQLPDSTLRKIVKTARAADLAVVLYLNLFIGGERPLDEQNFSPQTITDEWLGRLISNYEPFLLEQAAIAEEEGITGMMVNNFDYEPGMAGHEEIYQKNMLRVISNIRARFSGDLLLHLDPLQSADTAGLDALLEAVDAYIYTPTTTPLRDASNVSVNPDNLKERYLDEIRQVHAQFGKYQKPFYVRILIQSEKGFLSEGWREEAFCVQNNEDPCYQHGLIADFSVQANAYEGLMRALKEAHEAGFVIAAVETYGYWHTDVMLPDNSQPQIGHTVRNKPAESIVKAWFGDGNR